MLGNLPQHLDPSRRLNAVHRDQDADGLIDLRVRIDRLAQLGRLPFHRSRKTSPCDAKITCKLEGFASYALTGQRKPERLCPQPLTCRVTYTPPPTHRGIEQTRHGR